MRRFVRHCRRFRAVVGRIRGPAQCRIGVVRTQLGGPESFLVPGLGRYDPTRDGPANDATGASIVVSTRKRPPGE